MDDNIPMYIANEENQNNFQKISNEPEDPLLVGEQRNRGRSLVRFNTTDSDASEQRRVSRNMSRESSYVSRPWTSRSRSMGPDGCIWEATEAGRIYSGSDCSTMRRSDRSRSRASRASRSSRSASRAFSRDCSYERYEDGLGTHTGSYAGSSPSSDSNNSTPGVLNLVEEVEEAEEELSGVALARKILSDASDEENTKRVDV